MSKTSSVTIQMQDIFEEYTKDVKRAMNNSADVVAKEGLQKLRNTSPRKTGDYARGWAIKRQRGTAGINTVTLYNKTEYSLTHLLENPHEIVNRDHQGNLRSYGDTSVGHGQIVHIEPVEQWANEELPREIERELE